jgi:DNA segregation ATPase FtsK/SpoIIIE, S-DNA-T family
LNESSPKSAATANNLLSVAETLELLDRLRRSVRDAVQRTDELERDFTTRSRKLRAQFDQGLANERTRAATELDAANADVAAQQDRIKSSFNRRRTRITQALESARKTRLAEIEAEEGKFTFENQRGLLEAERTRETETQKNKTGYASFQEELANERAALDRLTTRARATLSGYRSLARLITNPPTVAGPDPKPDEHQLLNQLRGQRDMAAHELTRCNWQVLPVFFRFFRLWLCVPLLLLGAFALAPELRRFDLPAVPQYVWLRLGASLVGLLVLYFLSRMLVTRRAQAAALALHNAHRLADICAHKADASFKANNERILAIHLTSTQLLNDNWKQVRSESRTLRSGWTERLNEQARNLNLANEERQRLWLNQVNERHQELVAQLHNRATAAATALENGHAENLARITSSHYENRQAVAAQWQNVVLPTLARLQSAADQTEQVFPPWRAELWPDFRSPDHFTHAAKFASLNVELEKFCEVSLKATQLELPGPSQIEVPLLLSVPQQASVLFETKQSGQQQVIGALNNLILRLLTSAPPGRLAFTIFDPVGLGQNFAGVMHLADFEERLINSRIWTQQAQIEQRLADLNEHIEKVTQMYLRNEYQSLAEYNVQAGRLAEKYHFLVIADFPTNFSEVAVKRLHSIAASGPRCGVHLLLHWDQRKAAPVEFVPEELRKNAICIVPQGDGFALAAARWDGTTLDLDAPPDADLATQLLQQIGKDSTDSYRVEMPFAEVAPADDQLWTLDTTSELRVPVGRTGATKLQHLALGQGTRQHGLIAGKTGSGKSTLFHVIITNLSLWCSPDQVEFYLVDFKKGVEFKCYATQKLPHARVIAIESDREFGLSVLQRVDDELKRRGDLFRKLGAQDIAGYKRAGGTEPMPRVLLLIDEFQELFVEDDRVSQGAALLLDRIVRQGRAFGIHVLLGSQTLGGAYTLARATIGQMVVRIALQCNEADAYLIMNEDNPAPRLLSRPGEAIYNDDGGSIQGNSPFQVVWLPDQVRDEWLAKVKTVAERKTPALLGATGQRAELEFRAPIVFEGNAPANIHDNPVLNSLLHAGALQPTSSPRIWLGAPNSIKGPTEAVFRRQSGNHLLMVGQREEAALGMLGIALVSLAAQQPKAGARFYVFDCSAPDSVAAKFLERAVRAIPHEVKLVRAGDVDEAMTALAAEQQQRADAAGAAGPETFLLIHGLQQNKKLRFDEEMSFSLDPNAGANPGLQLNKLICEGASLGFHVIANCDTYNNVMRFLSRKALSEFEMRVVFQMGANDSASLIESPAANDLGLHRAILFNGQQGWTETFRPYALPDDGWFVESGQKLAQLHS